MRKAEPVTTQTPDPADRARVVAGAAGYTAKSAPPRQDSCSERMHAAKPWRPKGRK